MFKTLSPNIMVDDLPGTIRFYTEQMGFSVEATAPEQPPYDWASLRRDGVNLMFQTRASLGGDVPALKDQPIGGALTFYIQVDDVEALYAELKDIVEILHEPHTMFYGAREFDCRDCNGYMLTFAGDGA
jgi:uncharacterized glyoxalase superfamily protein PhnB